MEERERPWETVCLRKLSHRKPPFTIFVANLTFDTSEEDLLQIFRKYGKLVGVYVPRDLIRRRSRGFAFIAFCYKQEALNAAQCLNGRRINGHIVSLAWA
ncbi:serine/arginine-rich splicing factor SC35-like [Magnolia sinica]|uniref:serine/arginine-rich splicing factor SC35-like n=1 Tax=Magnolia sinica TaxID=86752 RepID=UPI0026591026|nr:serine/arginine-rich splicing factor SC35-like [Magnolia sinica]